MLKFKLQLHLSKAVVVLLFLLLACTLNANELGSAEPNSFSLVALPDTQFYAEKQPEVFYAQTQWVVDNLEEQKIVFVTHLGDIVERCKASQEWAVASVAMRRLDGKVPYGMVVGNHDMVVGDGEADYFSMLFGGKSYALGNNEWYGGYLDNNMASFQTFEAEGLKFVIIHLPCNAPDYMLKWADMVLKVNSDRRAIISTHMFLGPIEKPTKSQRSEESKDCYNSEKRNGLMEWTKCYGRHGNTPKQMWEKCFSRHKNVFLILCGDQSTVQAINIELKNMYCDTVHACMSDYKQLSKQKIDNGFLRIYRFYPQKNEIKVMTYSVVTKMLCKGTKIVPDITKHQFSLAYDMKNSFLSKN